MILLFPEPESEDTTAQNVLGIVTAIVMPAVSKKKSRSTTGTCGNKNHHVQGHLKTNSIVGCMFPKTICQYVSLHFSFKKHLVYSCFTRQYYVIIDLEYAYLREVLANFVNNLVCVCWM